MALNLSADASTSGDFAELTAGAHSARIVDIIELGTQTVTFEGKQFKKRQVQLGFEILDSDERRTDGRPFTVRRTYTASLHEKAALRAVIEALAGKKLDGNFNLGSLLGAYCQVSIVHNTTGDRTYPNVATVMGWPKGMPKGGGELPLHLFDIDSPDQAVFNELHERVQEKIVAAPEWRGFNSHIDADGLV